MSENHDSRWIEGRFYTGPRDPKTLIILAHGAGAPMDTDFMNHFAVTLAQTKEKPGDEIAVMRFEFPYMAARRDDGKKRPPPRAEKSIDPFLDQIAFAHATFAPKKLIIGGKSMGGRVASMIAAQADQAGQAGIDGLLCLGYPFHAPGKPARLRIDHLRSLSVDTLIIQGARDPFGGQALVTDLDLSDRIKLAFMPDGDHDLKPRKRIDGKPSNLTITDNLDAATQTIKSWLNNF